MNSCYRGYEDEKITIPQEINNLVDQTNYNIKVIKLSQEERNSVRTVQLVWLTVHEYFNADLHHRWDVNSF